MLQERLIIETKNVEIQKQMLEQDLLDYEKEDLNDRQELEELRSLYCKMKEIEVEKRKKAILDEHKE